MKCDSFSSSEDEIPSHGTKIRKAKQLIFSDDEEEDVISGIEINTMDFL